MSPDFKGRRLALANVFRDERTANEAAAQLGVSTGSVYRLIIRMHSEGILEADSDPDPPVRGTQFRLSADARLALEQLDHGLMPDDDAGRLSDDQRVLIVRGQQLVRVEKIFADPSLSTLIAWAAWLGASWLVALTPETDGHAWQRLGTAFESAGLTCERGRVDEVQTAALLRRRSAANLEQAEAAR
jgi:hypothetical protein